jgi:hypothetical protein
MVKSNPDRLIWMLIAASAIVVVVGLCLLLLAGPRLFGAFTPTPSLASGTRLTYQVDYDRALRRGEITEAEFATSEDLLKETIRILGDRCYGRGMRGVDIRADDRGLLVVECPRQANHPTFTNELSLAAELSEEAATLLVERPVEDDLDGICRLREFPLKGGVVRIGEEHIRYSRRVRDELRGLERGLAGTTAAGHPAGSVVFLESTNKVRRLIENTGRLELYLVADPDRDYPPGAEEKSEREKMEAWVSEHSGESIGVFNATEAEDGGPAGDLRWYPHRLDDRIHARFGESLPARMICVTGQEGRWGFTDEDVSSVRLQTGTYGDPEVAIEWEDECRTDFARRASEHVGERLAIIIDDEVFGMTIISEDLLEHFAISGGPGGLGGEDVQVLVRLLRSERLPVVPSQDRIRRHP